MVCWWVLAHCGPRTGVTKKNQIQALKYECIKKKLVQLVMQTKKDLELGSSIFFGANFFQNEKKIKLKLKRIIIFF